MKLVKEITRRIVLPMAVQIGLDRILLSRSKHSYCIINFHGVRSQQTQPVNNRHMPLDIFEQTLVALQKRFEIVPLTEIFELHRRNAKSKKKKIALTFDDGYLNNFQLALPILKKHNIPATFFIITKGLETPGYLAWPDIVDLLRARGVTEVSSQGVTFSGPQLYSEEKGAFLGDFLKTLGEKTEQEAQRLFNAYLNSSPSETRNRELFELVGPDLLRQAAGERILEIGSHSHNHLCMGYLDPETAREEFEKSKALIEKVISKKIVSFAFPDGSYSKAVCKAGINSGYRNLLAVDYKFGENNSNPDLLSRFTISNSTTTHSNLLRLAKDFDKYGFN